MGAWIETYLQAYLIRHVESHPTWVRGLKPLLPVGEYGVIGRILHGCVD